jgi:NAD-dependent deacetylase
LWAKYDPLQLATAAAFERDPALIWNWYAWRRQLVAAIEPNPAHYALARLSEALPKVTLVTQNVDGLHQRAGSPSVSEFHGNLFSNRCWRDGSLQLPDPDDPAIPPLCTECGSVLRPGVVWFGEPISPDVLRGAFDSAASCDLFFSIGTSSLVQPANALVEAAVNNDATIVEINPASTPLTSTADFVLAGKAGKILPELLQKLAVE